MIQVGEEVTVADRVVPDFLAVLSDAGGFYETFRILGWFINFVLLVPIEDMNFLDHWKSTVGYEEEDDRGGYVCDYLTIQANRFISSFNICRQYESEL